MPVKITVSQVRDALYLAEGISANGSEHTVGAASTSALGQWFHEVLGELVKDGGTSGPLTALAEVDADLNIWKQTLVARAYAQFIGPQLTRQQSALHNITPQVLAFWSAVQAACHWLAELTWSLRPKSASGRATLKAPWQSLSDSFATEEPLTYLLREPGWTDSVQLVGVADAIVRLATGVWCAIEFKLGKTSPAADLGQACLYHLMLSAAESSGRSSQSTQSMDAQSTAEAGTLAVISFHPERQEHLFSAAELASSRQRLINLIGAMANVRPPPNSPTQTTAPTAAATPIPPVTAETFKSERVREEAMPTEVHRELGRGIIKTLAQYNVNVSLDEQAIIVGPAFLRFPITLGRRTKVKAVESVAPELQVHLRLTAEPFVILDNGQLVIDVQRPDRKKVEFDTIRDQLPSSGPSESSALVPVGVDLSGKLICADLSKPEHSHLLVAGTTGSGKSEWLRLAIAGLITANTPDTLRLLIIDPKRNAFHALKASPFLWRPIVFPDEHSTVQILIELCDEMDRRYRLSDGADSFAQMSAKSAQPLPRIVCVCDEYRDLISRNRDERKGIEEQICRLGAKARAAGIHLILATQEPSRDTIKGPLDSNIPARVGLKMGKGLESKMLLNESGAEKLLGNGDLLFKDIGQPRRLQAPLMSDANRNEIFGKKENC
jgi:S-DNA-T family DNA segregation ATPase FtsK/SpoIIIE